MCGDQNSGAGCEIEDVQKERERVCSAIVCAIVGVFCGVRGRRRKKGGEVQRAPAEEGERAQGATYCGQAQCCSRWCAGGDAAAAAGHPLQVDRASATPSGLHCVSCCLHLPLGPFERHWPLECHCRCCPRAYCRCCCSADCQPCQQVFGATSDWPPDSRTTTGQSVEGRTASLWCPPVCDDLQRKNKLEM